MLDGQVARRLAADSEARYLYMTAVVARILRMPWDEARRISHGTSLTEQHHLEAFTSELGNTADAGARWCSIIVLARMRPEAPETVNQALTRALKNEQSGEHLRAIGFVLAGLDPIPS